MAVIASGNPINPSHTTMQTSLTPLFLNFGQDMPPILRPLTTRAGPQAKDVTFTIDGDPDGGVDRAVRDLTAPNLHHNAVDKDDRVDRLGSNDGCELFERNGSHATLCAEQKARVGETTLF